MIVANDADNADLATVYTLNATAGLLWREAEGKEFTASCLAKRICEVYDVDPAKALADAKAMVDFWLDAGWILDA